MVSTVFFRLTISPLQVWFSALSFAISFQEESKEEVVSANSFLNFLVSSISSSSPTSRPNKRAQAWASIRAFLNTAREGEANWFFSYSFSERFTRSATMIFLFRKLNVKDISGSGVVSFKRLGDRWEDDRSEVHLDFFFLLRGLDGATGGWAGEGTTTVIGSTFKGVP